MDGINILKEIIANEGSCSDWALSAHCKACPLSKLRVHEDGNHMSCIEAVGAEELDEDSTNARYKEVAIQVLLSAEVEKILESDDANK